MQSIPIKGVLGITCQEFSYSAVIELIRSKKAWVIMFKGRWELRLLYSSNEQMCPLLVLRQRYGNFDRGMHGGYNPQSHMHMECEVYLEERHLTRIVLVLDIILTRLLGRRMRPAIIAGL